MGLIETLRLALLDLSLHKFRSALAALGIIFGVASVVAMISISEGARQAEVSRYTAMGVENIVARSIRPSQAQAEDAGVDRSVYGLLRRDLEHVRIAFPHVRYAVGVQNLRTQLYSRSGRNLDLTVLGVEPDFFRLMRARISETTVRPDGLRQRLLTEMDERESKRICVVGSTAARQLFTYHDPLHQTVRIDQEVFTCVGVLAPLGGVMAGWNFDVDNCVMVPLQTASMWGDTRTESGEPVTVELDGMGIQMEDERLVQPTAERLRNYLEATHKLDDYELHVPLELMRQKQATQNTWALVMGVIAGISLLVGGIGIMNIMLSNVSDRRKEIGTRRAIGARQRDILRQFIIEAATLTGLGGLAGVLVGYAIAAGITYFVDWPTFVPRWAIVLSVGVSCLTGLIFGYWPALEAARVKPIEALRSE
jgi:putative ABC transport system permease protein